MSLTKNAARVVAADNAPYQYKGIWVRGPHEEYVVNEQSLYRLIDIAPADRVLDIGAHIGCSARYFSEKGAALVHSYEPHPDNFSLLKMNTEGVSSVHCFNEAIVGNDYKFPTIDLWLSQGKFTTTHGIHYRRGRQQLAVGACSLVRAVEKANPTVLKMDIEGGELELAEDFREVGKSHPDLKQIVMEVHYLIKDAREKAKLLKAAIGESFQEIKPMKYLEGGGWHTCIAVWKR